MKEHWELIRKSDNGIVVSRPRLLEIEAFSKTVIKNGWDKGYQIKYYQGDKLIEAVDLDTYFNG